uniref:hypothetical protein n=1 Tax=Nonomuraea sp. CA-252377 TaxID=3240003 RepID=UPI003F496743
MVSLKKKGDVVLFYWASKGRGATGKIDSDGTFRTQKVFGDNSFGLWTHVVSSQQGRVLFYNRENRGGATGRVDADGGFATLKVFPHGSFGQWTDITCNQGVFLFYNDDTFAAATGAIRDDGEFVTLRTFSFGGSFRRKWNWIVPAGFVFDIPNEITLRKLVFLNRQDRSGAVAVVDSDGTFHATKFYPPASFGIFTHVTGGWESGELLYYNEQTCAGATARTATTGGEIETLKVFGDNSFGKWTNITATADKMLFYSRSKLGGATGEIEGDGTVRTLKVIPDGSFGKWSHIVR